jgi:hypothetical protein
MVAEHDQLQVSAKPCRPHLVVRIPRLGLSYRVFQVWTLSTTQFPEDSDVSNQTSQHVVIESFECLDAT